MVKRVAKDSQCISEDSSGDAEQQKKLGPEQIQPHVGQDLSTQPHVMDAEMENNFDVSGTEDEQEFISRPDEIDEDDQLYATDANHSEVVPFNDGNDSLFAL